MAIAQGGSCSIEAPWRCCQALTWRSPQPGKSCPSTRGVKKPSVYPPTGLHTFCSCLYSILPTGKLSSAEFSPGFFPYFSPGLPQPLFQIPANHSSRALAHGAMGTSPAPHLLPSTLNRHLVRVSSFLQSVFLQPHTFHQSTLHCQSPIPIWDT